MNEEHIIRIYTNALPSLTDVVQQACYTAFQKALCAELLPCITMPYLTALHEEITQFQDLYKNKKTLIVLGIGGSLAGTKALFSLLHPHWNYLSDKRCVLLDNPDAVLLQSLLDTCAPQDTAVIAISKSGNTIETVTHYLIFQKWLQDALGSSWKEHMAVITNPTEGFLHEESTRHALLRATIPHHLGGRFSTISAVSILPLLFTGFDYPSFLSGASAYMHTVLSSVHTIDSFVELPSYILAQWHYCTEQHYTETIFFSYIPRFASMNMWLEQLWAESLGKEGRGTMPIALQGVIAQHSLQQMILDGKKNKVCMFTGVQKLPHDIDLPKTIRNAHMQHLENKTLNTVFNAEYIGTRTAFLEHAIPCIEYILPSITPYHIGKYMACLEVTTLLLGYMLQINPLNQPLVEYGKKITYEYLTEGAIPTQSSHNITF